MGVYALLLSACEIPKFQKQEEKLTLFMSSLRGAEHRRSGKLFGKIYFLSIHRQSGLRFVANIVKAERHPAGIKFPQGCPRRILLLCKYINFLRNITNSNLHQPVLDGVDHEGGGVAASRFVHDVGAVLVDGALRDEELVGNLLIRQPLAHR